MYLESASNPGKNYVNRIKVRKRWELQERCSALYITRKIVYPCGVENQENLLFKFKLLPVWCYCVTTTPRAVNLL